MLKKDIREKYKELRSKLTEKEIESLSLLITKGVIGLPIWDKKYYHIYLPIEEKKEVNTTYIIEELRRLNKSIVVSKSDFVSRELTHYIYIEETILVKNKYNILEPQNGVQVEPSEIEVVFIPMLAFDLYGNRVGYGKGFYDKFLALCQSSTIKIGISFFEAEKEIDDVIEPDIKIDYCVTPNNIYKF